MTPTSKPWCRPWHIRVEAEFMAGNLTRGFRDVLHCLTSFRGKLGIYPSHASLAKAACCSIATVKRALAHALQLELLYWEERFSPVTSRKRPRLRLTNRYFIQIPEGPVEAGLGPVWPRRPPMDHSALETQKVSKQGAYEGEGTARSDAYVASLVAKWRLPPIIHRT